MAMIWGFILENPTTAVGIFLAVAEGITRLTPTKKDDGFVKRLGKGIDFILARLPNRVK